MFGFLSFALISWFSSSASKDAENLAPLYDYLVEHKNVTVAFSPYGTVLSFVTTALTELNRLNIPTVVPTTSQLYGRFANIVGTLIPNRQIQGVCARAL